MEASIDGVGRLVVPKQLRDALGLVAGAVVDVSLYGAGLTIVPGGRSAVLVEVDGHLVADADPEGAGPAPTMSDDQMYGLIDGGRR